MDSRLVSLAGIIRKTKRVYIAGNGGSAANAIHIANDWVSVGVRTHPLTADIATLTATANDHHYDEIFAKQLRLYAERNDLLVVLSGSGRSKNIERALWMAKVNCAMTTCAVFGAYNEHPPSTNIDLLITAGANMQEAEEFQVFLGHEIMRALREGHIPPESLTVTMVNEYFEREKLPARCGAIEGRKIILSVNEITTAPQEHLEIWLQRITGEAWTLQVQPWRWPAGM